jgi:hypothetical protein
MVAIPADTPVTNPLLETVATALELLDQVTGRSVSVFPFLSFTVAESWEVWPTWMEAVAGET